MMDLHHALEYAAEALKQQDGGNPATETGWRSDELLEAWLEINREIDRQKLLDKYIAELVAHDGA